MLISVWQCTYKWEIDHLRGHLIIIKIGGNTFPSFRFIIHISRERYVVTQNDERARYIHIFLTFVRRKCYYFDPTSKSL